MPCSKPGEIADAAGGGAWDIGLVGAEPQRAWRIAFTPAHAKIEATCLVPPNWAIASLAEVYHPGMRVAVTARADYDIRLGRAIRHATLARPVRHQCRMRPCCTAR